MNQPYNANFSKLPDVCYLLMQEHEPGSRIVVLKRGQSGYYKTNYDTRQTDITELEAIVDGLNRLLGVTPNQKKAMLAGSLFGWHVQGADPDFYKSS